MDIVYAYCDGGCRGNQFDINIGGYGAWIRFEPFSKELYGGTRNTTNNIMELTSCIKALEFLEKENVQKAVGIVYEEGVTIQIIMDSDYVVKGMNEWINGWIKKGWKNSKNKPVENKELWVQLLNLRDRTRHKVEFIKVKGHSDNEGNIKADALANKGMDEVK